MSQEPERAAIAPAKPAAPLNRSLRLRAAGFALGALAFAGALLGGVWLWDRRPIPMFPNDEVGSLPEGTTQVRRMRAGKPFVFGDLSIDHEFEEAQWSQLGASLCGGEDVFSALVDAKGKYAVPRAANVLDHWRNNAKAIACGRALAKKLGRGMYYVRFSTQRPEDKHDDLREERKRSLRDFEDEPRREDRPRRPPLSDVLLLELDATQLPDAPPTFIPWLESGGISGVHCVSSSPRLDSDCRPGSKASARLDGTRFWVSGELSDIEQFGRRFSPSGKNEVDNEEDFAALEEKVKDFPTAEVGSWETFEPSSVLWRVGFTDFGAQRGISHTSIERAVYKYRASWAITERQVDGVDELQLVLVTGSETDSKELALDLKEWHTGIKDAILDAAERAPADSSEDEDLKRVDRELDAARRKIGSRTVRRAIVEREEKFVFLTFLREVDDDEAEAEQDWREDMKERGATAAKIIRAMLDGERPDMDLVRELGGRSLVQAVENGGSSREEKERGKPQPVE